MAACPSYTSSPMGDESQTPSGAKKLVIASTSPLSPASIRRRTSSTRSGVVDSSGISLRPLLGKAFGGSTGLVDVVAARDPHDLARYPQHRERPSFLHPARAANWASVQSAHHKHHPVAEVESLLLVVFVVLIGAEPVFEEAADRSCAPVADPQRLDLPDCIGGEDAHRRIKVTAIGSFSRLPPTLNQVGGRVLLRHRPALSPW